MTLVDLQVASVFCGNGELSVEDVNVLSSLYQYKQLQKKYDFQLAIVIYRIMLFIHFIDDLYRICRFYLKMLRSVSSGQ